MTMNSHVFYRRMGHPHPQAVRGEGVYLWDAEEEIDEIVNVLRTILEAWKG